MKLNSIQYAFALNAFKTFLGEDKKIKTFKEAENYP
jgi:hypothetical protein